MLDKLKTIKDRYDALSEALSDPEVTRNQEKFRTLAQEQSSLTEIVEAYDRYARVLDHIAQNRELRRRPTRSWSRWQRRSSRRSKKSGRRWKTSSRSF